MHEGRCAIAALDLMPEVALAIDACRTAACKRRQTGLRWRTLLRCIISDNYPICTGPVRRDRAPRPRVAQQREISGVRAVQSDFGRHQRKGNSL